MSKTLLDKYECENVIKALRKIDCFNWKQFYTCQAYITNDYISVVCNESGLQIKAQPIRSYNTIVGFVDLNDTVVYECGKYSTTTSKQFTQICNQIYSGFERVLAYR